MLPTECLGMGLQVEAVLAETTTMPSVDPFPGDLVGFLGAHM